MAPRSRPSYRAHATPFANLRPLVLAMIALALGAAIGSPAQSSPQEQVSAPDDQRPRIGLALSGGGARGAAHIGVLKVLEELHVKVDCIAGTSMGAIVGGLYASGMSPAAIEQVFGEIDWGVALSDKPPRRDLSMRNKDEEFIYPNKIEVGVKGRKIVMAEGLLQGQNLGILLDSLFLPVALVQDFDHLPIHFRALATDIVTGERVVLSKGDLPTAVRASMSIPGAFAPVEIDGRLLVDGGLADNLPVDVCRDMGADLVIAVDISTPLQTREQVGNMFQIAGQLTNFLTRRNMEPQLKDADLLILPDLAGFASADFEKALEIIPAGEKAACDKVRKLKDYSVPADEYEAWQARLRRRQASEQPVMDFVRLEGDVPPGETDSLSTKPGEPLDLGTLKRDIQKLYGRGTFKIVDFRLAQHEGEQGLIVLAKAKPWGPNYARLGFLIQSDIQTGTSFSLLAGFTKTLIGSYQAEWRNDLQLGMDRKLRTEFYQPMDHRNRWFVAPYGTWAHFIQSLYQGDDRIAQYDTNALQGGIDLGYNLTTSTEIRIGPVWGRDWGDRDIGPKTYPGSFRETLAGLSARCRADRLDSASFPREGTYTNFDLFLSRKGLGAESDYEKASLRWAGYRLWGRNILFTHLSGGSDFGSGLPLYANFFQGGFMSFGGFAERQLYGTRFGIVRIGYYRQLFKIPVGLGEGLYAGGWAEAGNVWKAGEPAVLSPLKYSLTIALGADTILGPVFLAISQATGGNRKFYFSLGRSF